jgi:Flp pilus assembly protein TadD
MRTFLHTILSCAFVAAAVAASAQTACKVATPGAAGNAAAAAFANSDYEAALAAYQQVLASHPDDDAALAGVVRSQIALHKPDEAFDTAKSEVDAHPKSAGAHTAYGLVLYRRGHIDEAEKSFFTAQQLDVCYALAHYGIARVARANSMHATADKQIRVAYQLDPNDPTIRGAWLRTLPLGRRIAELKKLLASPSANDKQKTAIQHSIDFLEQEQKLNNHECRMTSTIDHAEVPFQPMRIDAARIDRWGLDVTINGKTARLDLDTGASGLYIGHAFAERAGIKEEAKNAATGVDEGLQAGYTGFAQIIRVGNMEFADCAVDVSNRHDVIPGIDGLIGGDVFRQYLITLDYPDHKLILGPLPQVPHSTSGQAGLTTGGVASSESEPDPGTDRYIAPEMAHYNEVYNLGDSKLLVPSRINNKPPDLLMLLDTGAGMLSLSPSAAQQFFHLHIDNVDMIQGVSGQVKKVYTSGDATLQFGHGKARVNDWIAFDTNELSRDVGTEVAGFLGTEIFDSLAITIDYRDGLVNFGYDPDKDVNKAKGPTPPSGGGIVDGYVH